MAVSIQPVLTKEHRLSSRSLPPWKDQSFNCQLPWLGWDFIFVPVLESRKHQFPEVSSLPASIPPGSFSKAVMLWRNRFLQTSHSDPWPRASERCSSRGKPRVAVGIYAENRRSPLRRKTVLELRPALLKPLEAPLWQLKSDWKSGRRNHLVYTICLNKPREREPTVPGRNFKTQCAMNKWFLSMKQFCFWKPARHNSADLVNRNWESPFCTLINRVDTCNENRPLV